MTTNRRRHTLATYVDANLNDAMTAASLIDPALEAIDKAKAGHPTSTPGANPGTTSPTIIHYDEHGDPIHDNDWATERAALTPDTAVADEKALRKAIHEQQRAGRIVATITQRWATPSLDGKTVRARLAAIDANTWCANHLKHDMHEPKRRYHDTCETCGDFRTRYKRDAPIEILDYEARHGRLYETQIQRLLAIADRRLQAEKEARRAAKRAAREAAALDSDDEDLTT